VRLREPLSNLPEEQDASTAAAKLAGRNYSEFSNSTLLISSAPGINLNRLLGILRNSEYGVIVYAKADFHGATATATADELPIEDILTVEHDIVPLEWTEVFRFIVPASWDKTLKV
jgi:hypothetical protein